MPPPMFTDVVTPLVCQGRPRTLRLLGSEILRIRKQVNASTEESYIPSVSLSNLDFESSAIAVANCSLASFGLPDGSSKPFANVSGWTVELCALTVNVDATQSEGIYRLGITNPSPANCSSSNEREVRVVPVPTITDISPQLFCLDASFNTVRVSGTGFYFVDNKPPLVSLIDFSLNQSLINVRPSISPSSCTSLVMEDHEVRECSAIVFEPNANNFLRDEVRIFAQ